MMSLTHSMSEEDVRGVMAVPWVSVGSDSRANAPYGPLSFGRPHPRSYGTFPRVLGHYARDLGVLTFEEAVRKVLWEDLDLEGTKDVVRRTAQKHWAAQAQKLNDAS